VRLLDKYISLQELSDRLGMHSRSVRKYFLEPRKVRWTKIGKRIYILKKDAEELIEKLDVERGGGES